MKEIQQTHPSVEESKAPAETAPPECIGSSGRIDDFDQKAAAGHKHRYADCETSTRRGSSSGVSLGHQELKT